MTALRVEIPRWECIELLRRHAVGRLCVIDAGFPLAFPVNYAVDRDDESLRFVIRTSPTTIIGGYRGPGSLEVDHIDLEAGAAWSIIVRGTISQLLGERAEHEPTPLLSGRTTCAVLAPVEISGRRFTVSAGTDGFSVEWQIAEP